MQALLTRVFLIGLIGILISTTGLAQATASSSATTSGPVRATVGTFVFPQGSVIALELTRTTPCPCMCSPILIRGLTVRNSAGVPVYTVDIAATDSARWIGFWNLRNDADTPVLPGDYTIVVATSIGEFRATVKIVSSLSSPMYGRMSARASVCGIGLAVYRAVTNADAGTTITIQPGEMVIITLPGNPTTGYRWELAGALTDSILQAVPGPDYQPAGTAIGSGGTFLFRYKVVRTGTTVLKFVYHRSWENVPAQNSFTVTIIVR